MFTTVVDVETVRGHLDDPAWQVVDCRFSLADTELGRRVYTESHLPGALYAHLDEDLSGPVVRGVTGRHPLPSLEKAATIFSAWGIDENVQVVAYDDANGSVAARLWWLLKWLGHDAVAVLDGGWKAWTQAGLPSTAVVPEPMSRTFVAKVRPELLMAADAVSQMRVDPTYRLIDARTPERYRGEQEPIDPVAGHIPGADNVPFTGNIGPDGRFLTEDALRSRFTALFGTLTTQRVVSYCGSGVTGCHNLLAIAHAGLGDGVLYAGSWSEWIADPNRPIATGDV